MADYRIPVIDQFPWQPSVKSKTDTPPGVPAKGDRYLVIATASGDCLLLHLQKVG